MKIYLIRHAKPLSGDHTSDPDLSPEGLEQARDVAPAILALGVDRVFSSPLKRAYQTASPLLAATGMEATLIDGLSEADKAASRYRSIEYLRSDPEIWEKFIADPVGFLGGDPVAFRKGVLAALEAILASGARRAAVFTHGLPINVILSEALGLERITYFVPHYTSISQIAAKKSDNISVISVNETAHVRPTLLQTKKAMAV